jgi:hypothetical protein
VLVQPIDYFLIVWFALAGISSVYVAWDQFENNPEPAVMKWAFVLITLYLGPIGLLLYVLADKEPKPGTHEQFTRPIWKQGVGSTIHCVAGDATGIILAAAITAPLGLPMRIDLIVEYIAGFAFGLFIFQSLFMKQIMGGTYWENVRSTFLPEFISMNAMMAGMKNTKYALADIKIHLAGKTAWATFKYTISADVMSNGQQRHVDGGGLATAVLENRDGQWRIVHWHSSAPRRTPAAAPTPATKP